MKKVYYIFTILILFVGFGLASPLKSEAWFPYHPVNLGYNSPNNNYYNYQNNYNNYSNSYNGAYYGGSNANYHIIPDYGRSYNYEAPAYNQGYGNYNYNNNYSTYNNYGGAYGSYYPVYTYSGWSRSYSYCTGFYCSQY